MKPVGRDSNKQVKQLQRAVQQLTRKNAELEQKNRQLREALRILTLQLAEYRQKIFKKSKGQEPEDPPGIPRKRGAPRGHPGRTRKVPDRCDEQVDVHLNRCPLCDGVHLSALPRFEDHYQKDIVIPRTRITRFRHHLYWCPDCRKTVRGVGQGEMPGSYIGPVAKSVASFLHYQLHLPYRPIRRLFGEVLGLDFDPSSIPGFDRQIRIRGAPLYEQMKKSLPEKPFVHADETGWRRDGSSHWLWCFAAPGAVVYRMDRHRSSEVVTSVLGEQYHGVLISDFLAAYNRLQSAKQRCLVHLLRLIKKWQVHFAGDTKRELYFMNFKKLVKDIIALSAQMAPRRPANFIDRKADLTARLRRLLNQEIGHPRADQFRMKLSGRFDELVTCLDYKDVCSHNNWAERLLRGNVIMRKVTFGNRSDNGLRNHEVLMSLAETARLNGLNVLAFFNLLLTNTPAAASILTLPASLR